MADLRYGDDMGADLYIKNMDRDKQKLGFELSEKAVDAGYFRDCYSPSGLFYKLKLSWWRTYDEYELGKTEGCMDVKDIIHFSDKIIKARQEIGVMDKEYTDWYLLLLRFLKKAIDMNSPIIFSV